MRKRGAARGRRAVDAAARRRWLRRIDSHACPKPSRRPPPRSVSLPSQLRQFYALTKPRVVQLIVFCALIGMLLAVPGAARLATARCAAAAGIWLVAGAAAAFNCLVEQRIDARMARTAWRADRHAAS